MGILSTISDMITGNATVNHDARNSDAKGQTSNGSEVWVSQSAGIGVQTIVRTDETEIIINRDNPGQARTIVDGKIDHSAGVKTLSERDSNRIANAVLAAMEDGTITRREFDQISAVAEGAADRAVPNQRGSGRDR